MVMNNAFRLKRWLRPPVAERLAKCQPLTMGQIGPRTASVIINFYALVEEISSYHEQRRNFLKELQVYIVEHLALILQTNNKLTQLALVFDPFCSTSLYRSDLLLIEKMTRSGSV